MRAHRIFKRSAAGEQGERIEIALQRQLRRQHARRPGGVDRLVEAERVDPGLPRISGELGAGALGEADDRRVGMTLLRAPRRSARSGRSPSARTAPGARLPAQLSNNCTASTPAWIWPDR